MSGLFPRYTLQKVNHVFTDRPFLKFNPVYNFMLCMLLSANRPKRNQCEDIYISICKVFVIFYYTFKIDS